MLSLLGIALSLLSLTLSLCVLCGWPLTARKEIVHLDPQDLADRWG